MKIEFHNDTKSDFNALGIWFSKIIPIIESQFKDKNVSINTVFVRASSIKKLNKSFRNIDSATDVLSFNFASYEEIVRQGEIRNADENLLGEIYICPEYIENTMGGQAISDPEKIKTEIVRMTIHGILHTLGFDHKEYFIEEKFQNGEAIETVEDEMYILQERLLVNILKFAREADIL